MANDSIYPDSVHILSRILIIAMTLFLAYVFSGSGGVLASMALLGMVLLSVPLLVRREGRASGFLGIFAIFGLFLVFSLILEFISPSANSSMLDTLSSWINKLVHLGGSDNGMNYFGVVCAILIILSIIGAFFFREE